MATLARRAQRSTNIWPGFVDALATLLMVIIFLLMIFVLAQFFLGQALSGRDQALKRLEARVVELPDLLALERGANAELRTNLSQLSQELQVSVALRDDLRGTVARLRDEGEKTRGELTAALETIAQNQDTIADQRGRIAELSNDVAALSALKDELEAEVVQAAARLQAAESLLEEKKKEIANALARVADREAALAKAETTIKDRDAALAAAEAEIDRRLAELARTQTRLGETESKLETTWNELTATTLKARETESKLEVARSEADNRRQDLERMKLSLFDEEQLSRKSRAQVALLNRQLAALKAQLAQLNAALDLAESKAKDRNVQIKALGRRLNAALASKVQELSRYRSEFFGRLREVLGNQAGIRVVGDRFVFQSEVLFDKGAAELGEEGRRRLDRLAAALIDIADRIPGDIDWVLRVDGHTDVDPIATALFPSNWELSSARAVSVVKHLIARGLPPRRLVAAGFGPFSPIASDTGEAAKAKNRRIEFKFTQR